MYFYDGTSTIEGTSSSAITKIDVESCRIENLKSVSLSVQGTGTAG